MLSAHNQLLDPPNSPAQFGVLVQHFLAAGPQLVTVGCNSHISGFSCVECAVGAHSSRQATSSGDVPLERCGVVERAAREHCKVLAKDVMALATGSQTCALLHTDPLAQPTYDLVQLVTHHMVAYLCRSQRRRHTLALETLGRTGSSAWLSSRAAGRSRPQSRACVFRA